MELRVGNWTVAPRLPVVMVGGAVVSLFVLLGVWQLQRAEVKQTLHATLESRAQMAPIVLNSREPAGDDAASLHWRRIEARGTWDGAHQILLDNQIVDGSAGYFVFTPLRIEGSADMVLVNRGWVGMGDSRSNVPDIRIGHETVTIRGVAAPPPSAGLGTRADIEASFAPGLIRAQRLDPADLSRRLGIPLASFTLRLDADAPDGFRRAWTQPGANASRHTAYAVQWFAFALMALCVCVGMSVRRVSGSTTPARDVSMPHAQ